MKPHFLPAFKTPKPLRFLNNPIISTLPVSQHQTRDRPYMLTSSSSRHCSFLETGIYEVSEKRKGKVITVTSTKITKKTFITITTTTLTTTTAAINIGFIHVFSVVNIRRGPKIGLTSECEARGC